jgi:NAD(P)-dependent dehydrogenase (short-subunit alcohol dehydrogenase family)
MSSHEVNTPPPVVGKLAGKVALITGGSRGIGAAIALRLASEGARVVISYRNHRAAAEAVVAKAAEGRSKIIAIRADVTSQAETNGLIEEVRKLGKIDVLVNNAALFARVPVESVQMDLYERIFDTNLKGAVATTIWKGLPHRTQNTVVRLLDVVDEVRADSGELDYRATARFSMPRCPLKHR